MAVQYAPCARLVLQWYVVANWSKAFFLCIHCLSLSWWYYSWFHYRCVLEPLACKMYEPARVARHGLARYIHSPPPPQGECTFAAVPEQGQWTKYVSAVYVSTDLVALYMVLKLPHTTVVHHWASFILLVCLPANLYTRQRAGNAYSLTPQLVTSMIDLSTSPVLQKVCMYGFFSTIAFNVNFFLAERVCHPNVRARRISTCMLPFPPPPRRIPVRYMPGLSIIG